MKFNFSADSHACACIMAVVNGLGSANLADITTHIARISYCCCQNSPGASYSDFAGIASVLHCIIAAFCICTLLGSISKGK